MPGTDVLVIDASVALSASLPSNGFRVFGDRPIVAPPLMWSEVTSVLHELRWRSSISDGLARAAFDRFQRSQVKVRSHRRLLSEAWAIAEQLGWAKTYDAEYVALAHLLRCPLVTVDARLRRGAARVVEVIGPTEI